MKDTEFILGHLDNIAANLEALVSYLAPKQAVIYVDGTQQLNFISLEEAETILSRFGENCAAEMIGKTDYILVYDAGKKLNVDGEAYLPSGYLVMKSYYGMQGLDEDEIAAAVSELRSRSCPLAIGPYRIQAYRLE